MLHSYFSYGTVAVMGTIALMKFAFNIRNYAPDTKANRFFINSIVAMAVCATMEFFFCFHENGMITHPVYCYVTEICYSSASLISALFWCLCSETEQNAWVTRTKTRRNVFAAVFIVLILAVITTPFTHLVFYFTPDGHYTRSYLNNPLVYVTAVCIAKSGICALVRSFRTEFYLKRKLYRTFFYYALGILIAQIFQLIFGAILPFRIIGAVVVFYLVQEHTFKQNIFIDILSGSNNRTAIERYLKNNFEDADEHFAYVMIDLDSFKQINDQYGHSAGDRAIAIVSESFRQVVSEHIFFARYGGDEFVIMGNVEGPEEIDELMAAARDCIHRLSEKEDLGFCPDFSYGFAFRTSDVASVPELLNRADAAMYEAKQARKTARR